MVFLVFSVPWWFKVLSSWRFKILNFLVYSEPWWFDLYSSNNPNTDGRSCFLRLTTPSAK
jgi:hypothetical protein